MKPFKTFFEWTAQERGILPWIEVVETTPDLAWLRPAAKGLRARFANKLDSFDAYVALRASDVGNVEVSDRSFRRLQEKACTHPAFKDVKFWDELGAYIGTCTTCKTTIQLPSVPLTTAELLVLRENLFEFGEICAEPQHLEQVREYLRQQQMPVEFSLSAAGILIRVL